MSWKKGWVLLGLLSFLGFPGTAKADLVDGEKARVLLNEGARLIDVRTPREFSSGHLDGAQNIPVQELAKRMSELEPRDAPIVLYCRTGNRSANALRMLKAAGFTEVYDLQHMGRW